MATWRIRREAAAGSRAVELTYENPYTKLAHSLGHAAAEVDDFALLAWIVDYGECFGPGDLVLLSNGTVLAYERWRGVS